MKNTRHIIFVSIVFTLVLMIGLALAEKPQDKTLSRAVLKIGTLSCGGCFSTISSGLAPLEGYSGMGANLFRKLIAVDFTAPLTPEIISQTLTKVGYPGKIEVVDVISQKESFAYLESRQTGVASGGGGCCSSGTPPPQNNNSNQGSGLIPPSGSCCALPNVSQSSQDL